MASICKGLGRNYGGPRDYFDFWWGGEGRRGKDSTQRALVMVFGGASSTTRGAKKRGPTNQLTPDRHESNFSAGGGGPDQMNWGVNVTAHHSGLISMADMICRPHQRTRELNHGTQSSFSYSQVRLIRLSPSSETSEMGDASGVRWVGSEAHHHDRVIELIGTLVTNCKSRPKHTN